MKIIPPATLALIRSDASDKIFRLEMSVPGEIYLFIDSVAGLPGSNFTIRTNAVTIPGPNDDVFNEGIDYNFSGNFGSVASDIAAAIRARNIPGVWAEDEFDGARSGLVRIIIAKTRPDDDVRILTDGGNWQRTDESRRNGFDITLSTADAGHENLSDFGMILGAEPLKQSLDPITRLPTGAQFFCTIRASEGLKRLLSYHPVEAFEVEVQLGVRDRNISNTPSFFGLGRWWIDGVQGNSDGTITVLIKDALSRVAGNLVAPVEFPTLHPSQAVLLHLQAVGLSNNNGTADATFDPDSGNLTKSHFVVSHSPVERTGGDAEPNSTEQRSQPVLNVIADFLALTGDTLRVAQDGDLELVVFDIDAPAVAHLRAGPDDGFDSSPVEVVSNEIFNRITWNIATSPQIASETQELGKAVNKIEQTFDSKRSQEWTSRIFDLSIDNPYIGRSTRGWGPCSGSEYQDPANVNNRTDFHLQEIYFPGPGLPGGPYNPTTRFGVFSPHASGWCGFRLLQQDGGRIASLAYEGLHANLNAGAGRRAFIRIDPPGLFRDDRMVAPSPNTLARQEIIPGDTDYLPEIIAVRDWEINDATELYPRVKYLTEPLNDQIVQGPGGEVIRYTNIIPEPPFETTIQVPRFVFHKFAGQIDTAFNGVGDISGTVGRSLLGTATPFVWRLAGTTFSEGAILSDVTIPVYRSMELFERYEFGAPEIEFETSLAWVALEIGDVITIDDPTYVGFRRVGLDETITFEVSEVEIHWYSDAPRIRFRAVALKDSRQPRRFAAVPVTLNPGTLPRPDFRPTTPLVGRGGIQGTSTLGQFRLFRSALNQQGAIEHVAQRRRPFGESGDFIIASYDFADQPAICGRVSVQSVLIDETDGSIKSFELATTFDWDPDAGPGTGLSLTKIGPTTVLETDGAGPGLLEIASNPLGDTSFRLRVQALGTNQVVAAAHVRFIALSPGAELIAETQSDLSGEEIITGGGSMNLSV